MPYPATRSRAASISSSRIANGVALALTLALALAGCGGARSSAPSVAVPRPESAIHDGSSIAPLAGAPAIPYDAIDLLARSMTDSCAVCADRHREEGFEGLTIAYPPGTVLRSDAARHFTLIPGTKRELLLTDYGRDVPTLTFRFHDSADRLIGVADTDLSRSDLVARVEAIGPGVPFDGAIEVVAYAYGDGPTFLFSRTRQRVEVECRLLEVAAR